MTRVHRGLLGVSVALALGTMVVAAGELTLAENLSTTTQCAEEDNINIPISGNVRSFVVEATHPIYPVTTGTCQPDFANCPPADPGYAFAPGTWTLWDDGTTVVQAVREAEWWLPNGMNASVDDQEAYSDIHYLVVSRKIADANEWPQYVVLYMDGNLRLIPHPPLGMSSVCFGTSAIVGPAPQAARPVAEIAAVSYRTAQQTLEVSYASGGSATLHLGDVNRTRARVAVDVDYPVEQDPFVTLRSMYVTDGTADADHVTWVDATGATHNDGITSFTGGLGKEWLLSRTTASSHNMSAPDIKITDVTGSGGAPSCVADATTVCLNEGRFAVHLTWRTTDGRQGAGQAVELTDDTGYFWFFAAVNVEVMVKVLDGCSVNDRYWVFAGGLTNIETTLHVRDTVSGNTRAYDNPQGTAFLPLQDTNAFPTCGDE